MSISIKKIYTTLFFLGIFFIPFNSYEGVSFLGEYKRDGAIIFFLISIIFFLIDCSLKKTIIIPVNNKPFQLFILFVILLFVSTLVNAFDVYSSFIKQTSGISRFIRQITAFGISFFIFLTFYNIISKIPIKQLFLKIRTIFFYCFILISIYGFLETLTVYFNIRQLEDVVLLFDYFPFTNVYLDYPNKRISSFSYEPPFLAIFLITIAGWMFSYIITSKGFLRFLPTLLVFFITFFSGSRTALIVILFQFILFLLVIFSINKKIRRMLTNMLIIITLSLATLFAFKGAKLSNAIEEKVSSLNFKENLLKNLSNRTRFGIQYASLKVFSENPILGVGFGQQAYYARNKYPKWATHNNYEFKDYYLNDKDKSFPPGFNMYTRLLAELGIVGSLVFISLLLLIIYQIKKNIKARNNLEKTLAIVLLISFAGFIINWLQFDSFRVYGFWICFALFIKLQKTTTLNE